MGFSTSSSAFVICILFDNSHSDMYAVISHCGFNLHFLMVNNVEKLFMCLLAKSACGAAELFDVF